MRQSAISVKTKCAKNPDICSGSRNQYYNDIMSETKKDEVVDHFKTYEDYLNMFVTEEDMLYLGEEEIAR